MLKYETEIKGAFDTAQTDVQQITMEIVANFHYRDMKKYEDGSLGTITISPQQLRDCLAYMAGE